LKSTNLMNDLAGVIGARQCNKLASTFTSDVKAGAELLVVFRSTVSDQSLIVTSHSVTAVEMGLVRTKVVFRDLLGNVTSVGHGPVRAWGTVLFVVGIKCADGHAFEFTVGGTRPNSEQDRASRIEAAKFEEEAEQIALAIRNAGIGSEPAVQQSARGSASSGVPSWSPTLSYEPEFQQQIALTDVRLKKVLPMDRPIPKQYEDSLRRALPLLNDLKQVVTSEEVGKFLDEESITWKRQQVIVQRYCSDPFKTPLSKRTDVWTDQVSAMLWDLAGALAVTAPSIYDVYAVTPFPAHADLRRATAPSGLHRVVLDCRLDNERLQISNIYSNLWLNATTAVAVTTVRLMAADRVRV
jgi:hypothetical protein